MRKALPVVAIVGRPNVGKSTLFNRLLGKREAIVADQAGVTVDRLERRCRLNERDCWLIDTGGIVEPGRAELQDWIETQVAAAIELADCVLFVVDARAGCTPADDQIAQRLRISGKRVLLVANKAENPSNKMEFFALGLGEPLAVSARYGHGIGKLKAAIEASLPPVESNMAEDAEPPVARIAVLGRPNVGKSTLINAWLGEERVIASPTPGATRDAVDTELIWQGERVCLIDTAGIRRKSHVRDEVEAIARLKARRALARADAAVLVCDASIVEGIAEQDVRLVQLALDEGCALVIAPNKTDLLTPEAWRRWRQRFAFRMRAFADVPVVPISAKSGKGLDRLLNEAMAAARRNHLRIPTAKLNCWLAEAQQHRPPPADKGRSVKLKYIVQTDVRPPSFRVFANRPEAVRKDYVRYLAHALRASFSLSGVPVRFSFTAGKNPYAKRGD